MADNWRDFPLPDGSYSDDCRPFTQQDVVNYLPTFAETQGTRSRVKYRTVPGLKHFANVEGANRGGRDVEGKMFVVSGRNLYQIATDGTPTEIGVIPGTGFVSMTHNQIAGGNQLVIATGDNSYVYNTVTEVLTATGVPLVCVDFLNQRILGVDQARRFWRYSGVATATSWEELDNESAESSPDRIVGGIVSQGEWLVFGERTIEVFSNSPTEATAFQRTQVIEKGCASPHTICRLDNSVFFIGNDDVPYRLNGYTPTPIAPKAIIDAISQSSPRRLYAFTWEDRGYAVYYVTAQDGQTFGYDVTTQRWHRRESYGLTRWRINTLFKSNGSWYAGDAFNQRLYRLEWGYVYEGCEIMPRKIRTGVLHNDGNRVAIPAIRLTVATGGAPSVANCPEPVVPEADPWLLTFSAASGGTMKLSPDGDDWTAASFNPGTWFPGNARFARNGSDEIICVTSNNASGSNKTVYTADGGITWAGSTPSDLAAGGETVVASGGYWHVASNSFSGTQRAPLGATPVWEARPGPKAATIFSGTSGGLVTAAAGAGIYAGVAVADAAATTWVGAGDLGQTENITPTDAEAGGIVGYYGSPGSFHCVILSGEPGAWVRHANPFPVSTAMTARAPRIQHDAVLGLWVVSFFDRVAYGASLSSLTLSSHVFPGDINGIGSDGVKVIVVGTSGMMAKSTNGAAWAAITLGVPAADILDIIALGTA